MTISVIIPAYNEEKFIGATINSLWQLKRKPDEVLVVDGASTDQTDKIARQNGARVITVEHRGIGYARQMGLEAAKCDVVAFTDADTVVPPDWLNKIESTLAGQKFVGVFGTFRVPDGWWPYRIYVNYVQPILNQINFWLGIPMAPGQNMAFKRTVGLKVGGFPIDFKIAEDIEMVRRLMSAGKVSFRQDLIVVSSGRRGNEGPQLFGRVIKAFMLYFVFRRANKIGFPDIR